MKAVEPVTIAERVAELAEEYGSVRKAADALGFNRCYVTRVANGRQREALGPETLKKLGLAIIYVRAPQEEPAGPGPRTQWVGGSPWAK